MKQKQLLGLVAALMVLLLVAYLAGVFDAEISTVEVPEVNIPAAQVEEVALASGAPTWTLRKEAGQWQLTQPTSYPADSAAVGRLVRTLSGLALGSVVSTNPDRYAHYGVDSTAPAVTVTWPGGAQRFVVGNQGADYQSTYVRLGEDPRVFVAQERLDVPDDPNQWRDRTVFKIPMDAIREVAVQKDDVQYTVEARPEGWQLTQGGTTSPADSAAVARWLGRFNPLVADGFLPDVAPDSVRQRASNRLTLTTGGGAQTLHVWPRDADVALAKDDGDVSFQWQTYQVNTYLPDPASLKAK